MYSKKSFVLCFVIFEMRISFSYFKDTLTDSTRNAILRRVCFEILKARPIKKEARDKLLQMLMEIAVTLFDIF